MDMIMVLNATFNNISVTLVYRGGQFYWWRTPEYPEKTCCKTLANFITSCCTENTSPE